MGMKHYRDYYWKNGKPKGTSPYLGEAPFSGITFKIVADPYYRRISIEKYLDSTFTNVVYDSGVFDFRKLNVDDQAAWQKDIVSESENRMVCHIRDQDDRLILVEEYSFENQLCRECRTVSPHGVLLSIQKMLYLELNDPFEGAILYDSEQRIVMSQQFPLHIST